MSIIIFANIKKGRKKQKSPVPVCTGTGENASCYLVPKMRSPASPRPGTM